MRILYTCDATKTLRHDFKFDKTFTDIISSSDLPMWKRPEAKKNEKGTI